MLRKWVPVALLVCGLLAVPATFAKDKEPTKAADDAKAGDKAPEKAHKDDDINLPPFPADRTVHQGMSLDGHELKYDATVGSLPVLDEKGKTIASVMFTAYTIPGANRPVTFALNGGPGAASVYLNLGAIDASDNMPLRS